MNSTESEALAVTGWATWKEAFSHGIWRFQ